MHPEPADINAHGAELLERSRVDAVGQVVNSVDPWSSVASKVAVRIAFPERGESRDESTLDGIRDNEIAVVADSYVVSGVSVVMRLR